MPGAVTSRRATGPDSGRLDTPRRRDDLPIATETPEMRRQVGENLLLGRAERDRLTVDRGAALVEVNGEGPRPHDSDRLGIGLARCHLAPVGLVGRWVVAIGDAAAVLTTCLTVERTRDLLASAWGGDCPPVGDSCGDGRRGSGPRHLRDARGQPAQLTTTPGAGHHSAPVLAEWLFSVEVQTPTVRTSHGKHVGARYERRQVVRRYRVHSRTDRAIQPGRSSAPSAGAESRVWLVRVARSRRSPQSPVRGFLQRRDLLRLGHHQTRLHGSW